MQETQVSTSSNVSQNSETMATLSLPKWQVDNTELNCIRKRSSRNKDSAIRENKLLKRQVERMMELKEQLFAIRQRKAVIPKVPDPQIVDYFTGLKVKKQSEYLKQQILKRIDEKKKELRKFRDAYSKSAQEYEEKSQVFREKSALQRVLAGKMEGQLTKTKERFRQVEFSKVIVQGIRKVHYYRLAQILFNASSRNIFNIIQNLKENQQKLDQESIGNCLGYLGLFVTLVGNIAGAKSWINFVFKGPKSTIKSTDGVVLLLNPKENKLNEVLKLLNEQLYQIMRDSMLLKVENPNNFYRLCEELSKEILTVR